MKRFDELRDLVMSLEADFSKFYDKGNSAAGTRVRKGMQELKRAALERLTTNPLLVRLALSKGKS